MLFDVKDGGLVPNKEEFIMANLIWKKYSGGVKRNDEGMWELIEYHIKNSMKILYSCFLINAIAFSNENISLKLEFNLKSDIYFYLDYF